jgi:signal peptide peptidase SppA
MMKASLTLQASAVVQLTVPEARSAELPMAIQQKVAVIPIEGFMAKNPNILTEFFGGTSTAMVGRAVQAAVADDSIASVVLVVDSPGGPVDGLAEFADTIYSARGSKPIVASVNGLAGSAAYYAASQADKVFAGRTNLVGSIGTRWVLEDLSEAFAKAGVKPIVVDTGKFKSIGVPGTEITEEQRAEIQRLVDEYGDDFVQAVARGRGLPESRVKESADGRVWRGEEAVRRGLIDGIATTDETIARMVGEAQDAAAGMRADKPHPSVDLRQRRQRIRERQT